MSTTNLVSGAAVEVPVGEINEKAGQMDVNVAVNPKGEPSLGLYSTVSVFVGLIVGCGVFASPGTMYGLFGSFAATVVAWVVAGLLALFGGMCYAELGAAYPVCGGEQAYCQKFIGSLPSFVFTICGWITRPVLASSLALPLAEYVLGAVVGKEVADTYYWITIFTSVAGLALCLVLSLVSTGSSKIIQNVILVFKMSSVIICSLYGIYKLASNGGKLANEVQGVLEDPKKNNIKNLDLGKIAGGMYVALYSYDGWNSVNLVINDIKNPGRNLPLTLIFGLIVIIVLYSLVNLSFFAVLNTDQILGVNSFNLFIETAFGTVFGKIVTVIVCVAAYGSLHSSVYCNAESIIAGAQDNYAPKFLAKYHPKLGTPVNAHIFMFIISVIINITYGRKFDSLITLYSVYFWVFYALTAAIVYIARRKDPDTHRPYKAPIFAPILFIASAVFLIVFSFIEYTIDCVFALVMFIVASIAWYIFIRKSLRLKIPPNSKLPRFVPSEACKGVSPV